MRISDKQKLAIIDVLRNFELKPAKIYLFGSRTQDHLKGGDLDLLLIVEPTCKNQIITQKMKIQDKIMGHPNIDEMKTDLIIATEEELESDPFLISIQKKLLYEFS